MNIKLIFWIFWAGQLVAQTGYFKNRHIVVSRKHCHHLKKVTSLEVRLDDVPVDNEWILRRMDSGHKDESCPARPTKGLTFLQSSINPELFRLNQMSLTVDLENALLASEDSMCSEKGVKDEFLICLYSRDLNTYQVHLVAETPVKILTNVDRSTEHVMATSAEDLGLLRAVKQENIAAVRHLLSKTENIKILDPESKLSLLQLAVKYKNLNLVQVLAEHGADPRYRGTGTSPVKMADESGQTEISKLLLAYGGYLADVDLNSENKLIDFREYFDPQPDIGYIAAVNCWPKLMKIALKEGWHPPIHSIFSANHRVDEIIENKPKRDLSKCIETAEMLEAPFPALPLNQDGQTALFLAVGTPEFLVWLLKKNVEVNQQNTDGLTALHRAVATNDKSAVDLLLKHGADATIKGNYKASSNAIPRRLNAWELAEMMKTIDPLIVVLLRQAIDKK